MSGFETAYLTYALGRAKELGFATDGLLREYDGPLVRGIVTDPTSNPYLIQAGRTCTVSLVTGQYDGSMAELMTSFYPTLAAANANGATIWGGMSTLPLSDPVSGYDFLGSVAVSYIAGYPGGSYAWNWAQSKIESSALLNNN